MKNHSSPEPAGTLLCCHIFAHELLANGIGGTHHITIPNHRPLKTGTLLGGVLKPLAFHHKLTIEALLETLDL